MLVAVSERICLACVKELFDYGKSLAGKSPVLGLFFFHVCDFTRLQNRIFIVPSMEP